MVPVCHDQVQHILISMSLVVVCTCVWSHPNQHSIMVVKHTCSMQCCCPCCMHLVLPPVVPKMPGTTEQWAQLTSVRLGVTTAAPLARPGLGAAHDHDCPVIANSSILGRPWCGGVKRS
jgi:hypothetical protein